MTVETIFIARHGYRMNWLVPDCTSQTGLTRDPPLAPFGLIQARELAEHFRGLPEDQRPTAIFSSPYYRCLETAQPVARTLGLPIYVEHGLSEWYSPVHPGTGLLPRPAEAQTLRSFFEEIDPSWTNVYYPSREGEDVPECHDRADGVMGALVPEVERRYGGRHKRILLLSHAAPIIALTAALVGDRRIQMRVGTCSLTVLERKDAADTALVLGGWTATRLADANHLKEGASEEYKWGFEQVRYGPDGKAASHYTGEPGSENERNEPLGLQLRSSSFKAAS